MESYKLEKYKVQFIEMMKDVRGFPDKSSAKKVYKEKLKHYLGELKDKFGQEFVDKIANPNNIKEGKKEKLPTILVKCEFCEALVGEGKKMKHHLKKRHQIISSHV